MKRLLALLLTFGMMASLMVACDDDDEGGNNGNNEPTEAVCGNGILEEGEECDGTDFGGKTCSDYVEHTQGTLQCSEECKVITDQCEAAMKSVTIIGTTDIHSHLYGVGPVMYYTPLDTSDNDPITGGLARIATVINEIKAEAAQNGVATILVDSGDYLMGDMVDLLSGYMPPVYRFFQMMGYDAVTIGNHEFDWTPVGLATVLTAAKGNLQFDIPILMANIQFDATDPRDDDLEQLWNDGFIKPYTIKQIDDDFAVGIFGLMGIQADIFVPQAAPVTFWHPDANDPEHGWDQLQALIDQIRADGAQLVIQAGHAGIEANGTGEDRDMAANLHGLDVIMSGHRHQLLEDTMIKVNDTYIIATDQYGRYVSRMDVVYDMAEGKVVDATGMVFAINDTIVGDATVQAMLDQSVSFLDARLQQSLGITYNSSPVADINFTLWMFDAYTGNPIGDDVEFPLGNYIADAQRVIMNAFIQQVVMDASASGTLDQLLQSGFEVTPISVAFIEGGAVRDPIYPALGDGTPSDVAGNDVFKAFPLGIGPDGIPGYPMLTFYVTKKELKRILDLDVEAILGNVPWEYYLHPAGVRYVWDPTRPQFDKVVGVYICSTNDAFTGKDCLLGEGAGAIYLDATALSDDSTAPEDMVRIAVDYYVALMLPQARNEYGANLTIDPKDAQGNPVDFNDWAQLAARVFDLDPTDGTEITELKAWVALMKYTQALPDCYMSYDATAQQYVPTVFTGGELCQDDPQTEEYEGLPSFPRKVYDKFQTPATLEEVQNGDKTVADLFWQWGLRRNMQVDEFCATLNVLSAMFLSDYGSPTADVLRPDICGNGGATKSARVKLNVRALQPIKALSSEIFERARSLLK